MAKEAATVALREILHEAAMVSLEAVAKEAAKVAMHELRQGLVAREAAARMYMDDAATGEERVADAASVAAAWELINGDETEVQDGDDDDKAEDDVELCVVKAAIRVASTQREAKLAACAAMELEERCRAEELIATAATCAAVELAEVKAEQVAQRSKPVMAEMEKALAYQRDVGPMRRATREDAINAPVRYSG
jgi:hypothetical protein